MSQKIVVFDETGKTRELNTSNYNDDLIVGTIVFDRKALSAIKKYCLIIGYILVERKTWCHLPIDIQDDRIVMLEGTYNCLPSRLKKELIIYSLQSTNLPLWSAFFFRWQFLCDNKCFEEFGPMLELCSSCIGDSNLLSQLIEKNCHIYKPQNYEELKETTQNLFQNFGVDINPLDYEVNFKYLVDSVLNGYYIRFNGHDIEKFFYNVCNFCLKKIKGEI